MEPAIRVQHDCRLTSMQLRVRRQKLEMNEKIRQLKSESLSEPHSGLINRSRCIFWTWASFINSNVSVYT